MKNVPKNEPKGSRISRQALSRIQGHIPESGKLFEAFMENSPAQAWIAGADCTMFYMNKTYRKTFDLNDDWLLRRPDIFPAEYLKQYEENNRKVIRENKALETIEDGYDQNGDYRIFQVCKFPLGTHGGIPLIGGCMVDVTALHRTNQRNLYVSQATSDVIWEWDLKQGKLFVSEAYEKLLGYEDYENSATLDSHVHPDDLHKVKTSVAELLSSANEQWQMEYRYIHKNGEIKFVMNKAYVVRDQNGAPHRLIGALQDLTETRRLQQAVIDEQLQKQKQIIAAVMLAQEQERRHLGAELHDNINQLMGSAKLMIRIAQDDPEQRSAMLNKSVSLLETAIKETQALSHRLIAPSMSSKNFKKSVQEIVEVLNLSGEMKVNLQLPEDSALERINHELRLHLYRIIQEQINNIIKHAQATEVQLTLSLDESSCNLYIADNGIGFDLHSDSRGTGLNSMRSRVDIYKGTLELLAKPEKGFQVKIKIPL